MAGIPSKTLKKKNMTQFKRSELRNDSAEWLQDSIYAEIHVSRMNCFVDIEAP